MCIGETDEERRLRKTALVLEKQITECLKGIDEEDLVDVVIAYEPVWAIGSGKTPKSSEIEDSIKYITKIVNRECNVEPKVLYGGSVNKDNIKEILSIKNVDGVLIGSSSIDPKYMLSMLDLVD
jgi:triosephosphate isomerase